MMIRRAFLRSTLTVSGGLLLGGCHAGDRRTAQAAVQPPKPKWGPRTVLITSDDPRLSGGWVQNFTSPVEPLDSDVWKMWISWSGESSRNIGVATGRVGETWRIDAARLTSGEPDPAAPLALGNLPEGWMPVQPVYLRLRDGRHRVYFWAHAKGVVRYLAADSVDGRRFRVVDPLRPCLYHIADRAVSGDVLREAGLSRRAGKKAAPAPGEPLALARQVSNDATNVYQLPDGSFEMYSVALVEVAKDGPHYIAHDNIPGLIRVIDRYASADGLNWTERRRVIVPDAADPSDQQFYYLSVTHTDRGRIGLLGHYRCEAQTIDMEWCHSHDGITWQRTRQPLLPRSRPHALPDSYIVHAPHALVRRDNRWHLFYTGSNDSHNHKDSHGPRQRAVMHTTLDSLWS